MPRSDLPSAAEMGASATTNRCPPKRLAWYIARSAASSSSCQLHWQSPIHDAIPIDRLGLEETPATAGFSATVSWTLDANVAAASAVVLGATTKNSSPPYRPTTSVTRTLLLIPAATERSSSFPIRWPSASFSVLKPSRSITSNDIVEPSR